MNDEELLKVAAENARKTLTGDMPAIAERIATDLNTNGVVLARPIHYKDGSVVKRGVPPTTVESITVLFGAQEYVLGYLWIQNSYFLEC